MLAISRIVAHARFGHIRAANSFDDLKSAISEIQGYLRQLEQIDGQAARIEALDEDEIDERTDEEYDGLYEEAKSLWRSAIGVANSYDLNSDRYFDIGQFDSNCVASALTNA